MIEDERRRFLQKAFREEIAGWHAGQRDSWENPDRLATDIAEAVRLQVARKAQNRQNMADPIREMTYGGVNIYIRHGPTPGDVRVSLEYVYEGRNRIEDRFSFSHMGREIPTLREEIEETYDAIDGLRPRGKKNA